MIIPFYSHTKGDFRCFSNFYMKQTPLFTTSGGAQFYSSEQYFMWCKAIVFNDTEIALKILAADTPAKAKSLGRSVRNFDTARWTKISYTVMCDALRLKFEGNPDLAEILLSTGDSILVEASPSDRIWGVGLSITDPDVYDQTKWRGQNLLGKSLMKIREELKCSVRK